MAGLKTQLSQASARSTGLLAVMLSQRVTDSLTLALYMCLHHAAVQYPNNRATTLWYHDHGETTKMNMNKTT
eukprot:15505-Heterococcus_DN1.PRE.2